MTVVRKQDTQGSAQPKPQADWTGLEARVSVNRAVSLRAALALWTAGASHAASNQWYRTKLQMQEQRQVLKP